MRTLLSEQLSDHGLITKSRFRQLRRIDWNASVDPAGRGENAIKYLGQYVRHSVIRDGRIVAIEDNHVTFRVKDRKTGHHEHRRIEGVEFVRRYLQHVLPTGLHRIRYYGYLHAQGKAVLQWLQLLLDARLAKAETLTPRAVGEPTCPKCGSAMRCTTALARAPPLQRNHHFLQRIAA